MYPLDDHTHFNSFSELKKSLDLDQEFLDFHNCDKDRKRSFCYLDGLTAAIDKAENGYPEALDDMPDGARDLIKANPLRGARWSFDVADGTLDVGAYMSGRPDCFFREQPDDSREAGKIVRIVVGGTWASEVDSDNIYYRGAAIAAAVDGLEARGYRVELDVFYKVKRYSKSISTSINIKKPEQHLDVDRLICAVTLPDYFRRIGFRWMEVTKSAVTIGARAGGSYGRVIEVDKALPGGVNPHTGREYDIIFTDNHSRITRFYSPASSLAEVAKQLKSAGIELTEN